MITPVVDGRAILLSRGGFVGQHRRREGGRLNRPLCHQLLNVRKLVMPELVGRELLLAGVLPGTEADNFRVVGDGREHHDGHADRMTGRRRDGPRALGGEAFAVRHRDLPRKSIDAIEAEMAWEVLLQQWEL